MHNKRPVSPVHHGSHLCPLSTTIYESGVKGLLFFSFPPRSFVALQSLSLSRSRLSFSFNVRKLDALRLPLWTFFLREVHLTRCERKEKSVRCEREETARLVEGIGKRDTWREKERGRERMREEEGRYERSLTKGNPICTACCSLPPLRNRESRVHARDNASRARNVVPGCTLDMFLASQGLSYSLSRT